ncbi:uncharacterized protein LOC126721917 [Quercus robur]|uniref:uncharacterized protein LOC126721917 n=1 Tax=Quercus robur TaxID=38942 RepID=UPI0021632213|nr:uncharacterized protein LOC126721917 [Quercus robur]
MRWFDGLKPNSIDSFKQLTQAFGSRFITCSRAPRPLDSLLSLSIREGETLKAYSDRYWEMYNEIEGNFDDVAISTFKSGLPVEHGLRKSLTGKPVTSLRQLMDRIDKYKSVEEDQQLGKVNVVFRDPVYHVLEKIKNELFFKLPNKMAGDPMKHQNLYCQYHQEPGHTTENRRNLRNHLDQLV